MPKLVGFAAESQAGHSQRQYAEEWGIPLSTLQHWLSRRDSIDADPAGVAFLHRLVLAAQVVITLLGGGGIRLVCMFLELSGLATFVAASYGVQQKVTGAMEQAVVEFGREEPARLAEDMAAKQIAGCEDETFHPQVGLVAIEPGSDYILLEQYSADRPATTWTSALEQATAGLRGEIIQATSAEGTGLLRHVAADLGAHHSPDLFHVQHELGQGALMLAFR